MNNTNLETVYNMLERNAKGKVINNHKNVLLIFREDQNLNSIVQTNEFTQRKEIKNKPVWRKNEYVRQATKITFTACLKRIMEPGCKHDTVLVLVGDQGIGKSYILSKLGMDWYNESFQSCKGDEAFIKISSSWIVELSELTALKHADAESIKAFISAKEDVYRPKYAKHPIQSPRRCVFFGTTNNMQFLKTKLEIEDGYLYK